MSKKGKLPSVQMDFQLGFGGIIPSTQEAYGFDKKFLEKVLRKKVLE